MNICRVRALLDRHRTNVDASSLMSREYFFEVNVWGQLDQRDLQENRANAIPHHDHGNAPNVTA